MHARESRSFRVEGLGWVQGSGLGLGFRGSARLLQGFHDKVGGVSVYRDLEVSGFRWLGVQACNIVEL